MIYVHKICNAVCNAPITIKNFTTFLRGWDPFSINNFAFFIGFFFYQFSGSARFSTLSVIIEKFEKISVCPVISFFSISKFISFFISLPKMANFLSVWILSVARTFKKNYQFNFIRFSQINAHSWSIVDIY